MSPDSIRSWLTGAARRAAAFLAPRQDRNDPAPRRRRSATGYLTCDEAETWTGLACLALLPEAQPAEGGDPAPAAVAIHDPGSPLAAAFRGFHSALLKAHPTVRVIALTSALPGDGKTTCTVALARQSALEGHRTVLVDCDLRRGSATAELRTAPKAGLLEVIYGQATLREALTKDRLTPLMVLPVVSDLAMITRATHGDVFATADMLRLMSTLRQTFDYVFLDTPPLLVLVDGRRLAPLADTFLLLARWRSTPKEAIGEAIELLNSTGTAIGGLVLTRGQRSPEAAPDSGYVAAEPRSFKDTG